MKDKFETCLITHCGEHVRRVFAEYDGEDGYADPIINAMWIGFNAGVELADL